MTSDRDAKCALEPLDDREVLRKLCKLDIATWQFKDDDPSVRHIGPVAQDFHAAFGFGGKDDKRIATVDADGVAFAAIQALSAELEEERTRNDDLEARLEKLETLLAEK